MNLLHAIRRRTRTAIGDACDASYQRGHHEGWQAGWNAALLTQPAQQNPVPLANSEHLTTTTGSGGGGYVTGGGGGGSDQPLTPKQIRDHWQAAQQLCTGTTKAGFACQLPVTPGTNTCHHHRHRHEPPPPKRPNPGAHDRHP